MNENITPSKFAEILNEKLELTNEQIKEFDKNFFSIITRELKNNDSISIFGFGTFKKVFVEETQGRNPQTGEQITIKKHYRIKFVPAAKIATRINADFANLKPIIIKKVADTKELEIKQKKPPLLFISLILILLILILGFITIKKCNTPKPVATNLFVITKPEKIPTEISESTPIQTTTYSILSGDNFSELTEKKWGDIALWPYLYMLNIDTYPDPDVLLPGDILILPSKPDKNINKTEIEQSIFIAYNRYKELIKNQKTSFKNANRKISVLNVLKEAETLYPGFIENNKSLIAQEDFEKLKNY
jgi:DNA-binding protein HU-beta